MKRRVTVFLSAAAVALVLTSAAWAIRFTDESYFTPAGTVGVPYSFTFTGAGGCGPALPYQFTIIGGNLPPGLGLAMSGLVSGTPTRTGSFSFWVNLSDQNPPSADWCRPAQSQREFTIVINGPGGTPTPVAAPSITTASLPEASVGNSYSTSFAASGGGNQSWSIVSGSLPGGLSLGSNGVISGTPQSAGSSSFTVKVTANGASSQKQFTLTVSPALQIDAPASQVGEVAVPLAIPLNASGGNAPYRWEITAGSFPVHVGFIGDQGNGSVATIKGVPADAGTFSLTFKVTDVHGRSTVHTLTLRIADKLRLVSVSMPRLGHVGQLYRARGLAEGGLGAHTWAVAGGRLPAGLRLDPKTGVIRGRPLRRGHYVLYLTTKDELGATRSRKLTILIAR
jgi:large repetitive protein